jgi:hypothetical protein
MSEQIHTILPRLRQELAPMRGLWPNMEADLYRMGIAALGDLRGKQPEALAEEYRALDGHPPDPVLLPYFTALIAFAETGVATPWWRILRQRAYAEA